MKGTIHRGKSFNEDEELRLELSRDSKSRAENVMIVDLMRNDFSRICELNSVRVPKLFEATRYNSLHQLTSRVEGKVRQDISLSEIFKATFPAGSITGAPKIRSMEIITELEKDGRRLYTGSAGIFHAGGDFTLNVCIRTLVCQNRKALLGIGSGIVADSAQQLEWQECLLKSSFLNFSRNHSEIFETMLWEPENGIYLLESHLLRLKQSCLYFRTAFDELEVRLKLTELIKSFGATQRRLRLSICNDGLIKFTHSELLEDGWGKNELRVLISDKSINSNDTYLYHKTDYRQLYNESFKSARQKCFDEVIFFNEKDQLCEGAISNIFIRKANQWLTPKLSCGLLPGTWRAQMVIELKATESIISLQELLAADEVIIGNSLRRKGVVKDILSQQALKF
ncbi:MAG: chorismate-binding protein, partial [Lentisphaeraceae bacterium]|nr:chorismate-binding protein [Lentisphaeraceae bacterium]